MGIDELQSAIKVFRPHLDVTVSIEELKAMLNSKLLFHAWFLLLGGIEVLPPCPTVPHQS